MGRIENYPPDETWIPTALELPPEDIEHEAMDGGGHVQTLVRDGNLWFFPDRSMYVYFTPKYWKPIPEENAIGAFI